MDADCLIKLTKAGIKESVCKRNEIAIPIIVKMEVVDAGKIKGLSDAEQVEKNIQNGIIRVVGKESFARLKGDHALIEIFKQGKYDTIATDDAKLIRFLRAAGIPYILPGLFIYFFYQGNFIDKKTALIWLEKLSVLISEDEQSIVKILLEEKS